MKQQDPTYVQTNDGRILKFNSWYWFSFANRSWPGCQAIDEKTGESFGIALSNIKAKIYEQPNKQRKRISRKPKKAR